MWLFASDDTLRQAQRLARQHNQYGDLADPRRREDIDDEREVRTNARLRAFGWLVIGPPLVAAVFAILAVLARWLWS